MWNISEGKLDYNVGKAKAKYRNMSYDGGNCPPGSSETGFQDAPKGVEGYSIERDGCSHLRLSVTNI